MGTLSMVLLLVLPLAGVLGVLAAHHHPRVRVHFVLWGALAGLALSIFTAVQGGGILSYTLGGWEAPFGIELRTDPLGRVFILLGALSFAAAALYQAGLELSGQDRPGHLTYHVTFPLLQLALNGLFMTHDFFNFYVFFELAAVTSYLLVAQGRHRSLEAAWKFAAQSILGSAALVSAVAFIYGSAGTLNMSDAVQRMPGPILWLAPFVLVAFLIKGSFFPFHFWQPDAYSASTTAGSAVLAGAVTNIGVFGFLRFWPMLFGDRLNVLLLWLGAASILFGAVAAWREADVKRMLGFSSTSQLGFVLLALGWGSDRAVAAAVAYAFHHGVSKVLLFLGAGTLTDAFQSSLFTAIAGRGAHAQAVRGCVLLGFISLIGLPPAVGFVGKLGILGAGVQAGAWPWVAVAALGTLLTLIYAVRAYQLLFWDLPGGGKAPARLNISGLRYGGIFLVGLAVLAFGLYGRPLWRLSADAAAALRAPHAVSLGEVQR